MKTTRNLVLFTVLVIGCLMNGCGRGELPEQNVVFIKAAEKSVTTTLTVDNTGGEMAVLASSSQLTSADVLVDISIDTSLIEKYNQLTGNQYSPLPNGSYSLSAGYVTIPAGRNVSDAVSFKVISTKEFKDGVSYMMPISIKNSNGLPTLEASRTLYVLISRTVIMTVASLTGNFFHVDFKGSEKIDNLSALTLETRFMANSFQQFDPYISTIMGCENSVMFRLGDVTVLPNQLQVTGPVSNRGIINVPAAVSAGVWYHVAAVYDGNKTLVYLNGEVVASENAVQNTINILRSENDIFRFGYSYNGRLMDGYISESRLWARALTAGEIRNGMCGVSPASPGLLGYWKFNEGTGNIAADISGNGFDAVANGPVTWIPDVRCN